MKEEVPVLNNGWACGLCEYACMVMPGAADDVMRHIKEQHPANWEKGSWSMQAIRPGLTPPKKKRK